MISPLPLEKCFGWNAHNGGIERLLVSHDNLVVVTADSEEIRIWELTESELYEEKVSINLPENEKNVELALSEDGAFFAISGTSRRLEIWKRLPEGWDWFETYHLQ